MAQNAMKRCKSLCLSLDLQVFGRHTNFCLSGASVVTLFTHRSFFQVSDSDDSMFPDNACKRKLRKKGPDPRRWWVLFLYGCAAIWQVMIWNTWSPIANSALFAFPSWRPSSIALLNNWGCITFLIFIVPCCWFLNNKGLRTSFIFAATMSTVGSGLRLLPVEERLYTVLVHVAAIFNAIGGVSLSPAILLLSSTWFAPHERTTATGIGTTMSMLGIACSYVLGPTIVSDAPASEDLRNPVFILRRNIRTEIMALCVVGFLSEIILLFLIIFFFPEKPAQPPSRSTILKCTQQTDDLASTISDLMKKYNFWTLAVSASMCSGVTGPWLSLLPIVFANTGITQVETASIGFWTIILSCALSISVSKISDFLPRKIRYILIGLIFVADVMFVWILLITTGRLPFNKEKLALTVICGLALVWAAPPLFYEFGAEITYPISEGVVGGFMMAMNNAVACCIYLQLYIFPDLDVSWMNYALVVFGAGSLILLFFIKDEYNRLDIDRGFREN